MDKIEERVLNASNLILEEYSTVRKVAKILGCSKSTIHKDLTERLALIDKELYLRVRNLLDYNKKVRHIRGGEATRKYYIDKRKES